MKSPTKQVASPTVSCTQGFNSTLLPSHPQRDGTGISAQKIRQMFALALMAFIVSIGPAGSLFAQSSPTPSQGQDAPSSSNQSVPPPDQSAPSRTPLSPEVLGQLVAPIALYPDALVAQILAASTYPSQVEEAEHWLQSQGNIQEAQLAASANSQKWDPSVKALIAFPTVLAQMANNVQWTEDLGNAYYNQSEAVLSAVQTMRERAQDAGSLHDTPQQKVSEDDGDIVIAPADPTIVYVPIYNPWEVYGAPIGMYPGYFYGPPAGLYYGSGLGFGIGVGMGAFGGWGWGWPHWGFNWRNRAVIYRGNHYYPHSPGVIHPNFRGPSRPGGFVGRDTHTLGTQENRRIQQTPDRGAQQNRHVQQNRGSGGFNRSTSPGSGSRPGSGVRPGGAAPSGGHPRGRPR